MLIKNDQITGLTFALIGVLAIVPDSLFLRLIQADILTTSFWRSLIAGIVISLGLLVFYRKQTILFIKSPGINGIVFIISYAIGNVLFITAIELTSVASALFIISTTPVFAAIISRFFLKEKISLRMTLTILGSLIGIGVIVSGTLRETFFLQLGDLAALGVALSFSINLTSARIASNTSMIPAVCISCFLLPLCLFFFIEPIDAQTNDWLYLLILSALFVPVATSLMSTAPRYITSSEVSLIILLEAILAPLLIWYVLGENPGLQTIIGGIIIISVLLISNLFALKKLNASNAI